MPSKRRLAQLLDARLAAVEKAKKRKVEQSLSTAQSCNKPPRTIDTSDSKDSDAGTWFWHMCADESESKPDEGDNQMKMNENLSLEPKRRYLFKPSQKRYVGTRKEKIT